MREIVLDTETTGLDPEQGDRIVEFGALELINHLPTGKKLHLYINPERNVPSEAVGIHGLDDEFLKDKPIFSHVAQEIYDFIRDDPLVIHNAAFDIKFINAEFKTVGFPSISISRAIDTLSIARSRFPGASASLDALCRRFKIDNSHRTLHGALLDSEILAEVYLELLGGRQPDLILGNDSEMKQTQKTQLSPKNFNITSPAKRQRLLKNNKIISDEEKDAHYAFISEIGPNALWWR